VAKITFIIQALDRKDDLRSSGIKYSDEVINKLKLYLTEENKILPQDTIVVRLYGPSDRDNPCRKSLIIHYKSPKYSAEYLYSTRLKTASINVLDMLDYETKKDGNEYETNDIDNVFNIMHEFYTNGLNDKSYFCHSSTLLDKHLIKIYDEFSKQYSAHHYILANDGDFQIKNNISVTNNDFSILNDYVNGSSKILNSEKLCKNDKDTFTIIGMDYGGNLNYRETMNSFFETILSPCYITFKNI